ncbi:lipid-A-disaccharide synthase [Aggregatibacter segnis ATCC 33393]|uniref:Lipid-A-disaccharide synthase n=2 Tax=Aggregatibacter segnis TaxID=739 RepID=E6KVU2_9PAST|nr:lipid-A-disaccharide synthase [Aggregatibacter segnis ATCC 33393]
MTKRAVVFFRVLTMPNSISLNHSPTIAIIAGEVSGDILGAGLIHALKACYPHAKFIGIGGERMIAEGFETLFDMEELSVMGLVEVLKHLPRLLKIRRSIIEQLSALKPDVFIGIDAPDFNLDVELKLKQRGIKTIHYVSPSVWAWRQKRVYKIAAATNLVLAFLPFEKAFYDRFNVPCRFIGHTMADAIPLKPNRDEACQLLNLDPTQRYVAMLVGSRGSEVEFLSEPFLQTAQLLHQRYPDVKFLVPLINQKLRQQFEQIKQCVAPELDMILLDGNARAAMITAEATLLASGTAALEAMLCKSPMVVGYRMKPFTYFLAKRLVKTKYVSLPNLLADEMLVPELIQEDCNPTKLAEKLSLYLSEDKSAVQNRHVLLQRFAELHQRIQCNADQQAAQAVIDLLEPSHG